MKIKRFSSAFLGMNSTLLIEEDTALLVDPGVFPDELEAIQTYLIENYIHLAGVIITHTHGDHISGWYAFESIPTFMSTAVKLKKEENNSSDVRFAKGLYKKYKYDPSLIKFPEFTTLFQSGQSNYIDRFELFCFHTPGHAMDLTTYILPESKVMITGDMLVAIPVPYILESFVKYYKSLKLIKELVDKYQIEILIPGHANFAHSSTEIMTRIQNEIHYIESTIEKGIPILQNTEEDLMEEQILLATQKWYNINAHHYNIKTMIKTRREIIQYFR
jgi:glyoxylase-like metal-dependent hydrolase (beta-lactamase superfamily II)